MTAKSKSFGDVFDAHTAAEFQTRDIDATMATMGGRAARHPCPDHDRRPWRDAVRAFYETWFIGKWPEDTVVTPVSRTIGETGLVDELIISFTHDWGSPAILHGEARARSGGSRWA